jgi:hypothetical protein
MSAVAGSSLSNRAKPCSHQVGIKEKVIVWPININEKNIMFSLQKRS